LLYMFKRCELFSPQQQNKSLWSVFFHRVVASWVFMLLLSSLLFYSATG
jgi:hypothetical protein